MEKLFSYIFSILVGDKDAVKVSVSDTDYEIRFLVKAGQRERLRIIGRDGKVITSVRDYFKAVSKKFNKKVYISIE
jgi:predicted RNA-binding protein YlqC (UPF0109 family)